ncbi:glycosyltransferase 61 family protein [Rubritalea sp.]|uniref:glycosyltransferase 61 family protein n=1 Tax=Rubritalea sp. TaxID=2109375 RepID=UPI003EF4FDA1
MRKKIHLTFKNRAGSVEHYYHFLLGVLIPLALFKKECGNKNIYIRSCGIMDEHLLHFKQGIINISEKTLHEKIRYTNELTNEYSCIDRPGFDSPAYYNYEDFSESVSYITSTLSEEILKFKEELNFDNKTDHPCIVMIDREPPHPFYLSNSCERKDAGTGRRSISNYDELYNSAYAKFPNIKSVTLEGKSLAFQIALFSNADIIIAQHGAALANLIWCRPNTSLIEIDPYFRKPRQHFIRLANCMKLDYQSVKQNGEHGKVNPKSLIRRLKKTHSIAINRRN